jgi:predicted small metal-binding protein
MKSKQGPGGSIPGFERVIYCPCGYVVRAGSEDDLVSRAMTHAKESHQMDLTREQALAMARPA